MLAIQKNLKIFPPEYEMVTFTAYAHGYQKAKDDAERSAAAQAASKNMAAISQTGASIVELFPNGVIRMG